MDTVQRQIESSLLWEQEHGVLSSFQKWRSSGPIAKIGHGYGCRPQGWSIQVFPLILSSLLPLLLTLTIFNRRRVVESSMEIKELESKLKTAYVMKERHKQVVDKQMDKIKEKVKFRKKWNLRSYYILISWISWNCRKMPNENGKKMIDVYK